MLKTYYDGKRKLVNGRVYYWRGWTDNLDHAFKRLTEGAYVEGSFDPHMYAGRLCEVAGWHIWTVSKRAEQPIGISNYRVGKNG